MYLQTLSIHNIASIEDAMIDFQAEPLNDSEVFLITGKTGAGKSTILDAICLALYADTPRLDGTKMQGNTEDGDKTVKVDDPRQLMRRNTGRASVMLTFTGNNGTPYRATWAVARARNKATGNIQQKSWQLENLNTGHTLTNDQEIRAEINAAIGLDFSQFCRTTMLAQGEFTRFLNSKDNEKAEILEKLTGVDAYSKIGAKVFAVTAQKEQALKHVRQQIEDFRTLNDDEVAALNDNLRNLEMRYAELKAENEKVAFKREWIKTNDALVQDVSKAEEALRVATTAIEDDTFRRNERLVQDWNMTIDARIWMTHIDKAKQTKAKQTRELGSLADEFADVMGAKRQAEQELQALAEEVRQVDDFLWAQQEKSAVYEKAQTIIAHLNTIADGREAAEKSQADMAQQKTLLEHSLTPALQQAETAVSKQKEAFGLLEAKVTTQADQLARLNLSALRSRRDKVLDQLGQISEARLHINNLDALYAKEEKTRRLLDERKDAIAQKRQALDDMKPAIHDARLKMDIQKDNLERQSDTINKFATTMRLKLKVGDTCPVCRQRIAVEVPHEDELKQLIVGLQQAYDEAKQAYEALNDRKVKAEAQLMAESAAYNRDLRMFDDHTDVKKALQQAQTACKACGIEQWGDTTLASIDELDTATKLEKELLDASIAEGERQESQLNISRKTLETKRKALELSQQQVQLAERKVNDCRHKLTTAQVLIETKNKEVEAAQHAVARLIDPHASDTDWMTSPRAFATLLEADAKTYNAKLQHQQTLAHNLARKKENAQNVSQVVDSILSAMPSWSAIEPTSHPNTDHLLAQVNKVNTSLASTLAQLQTAQETIDDNQERLSKFLDDHSPLDLVRLGTINRMSADDITQLNASIRRARENVLSKQTLLAKMRNLHEEHLKKQPPLAQDETEEALTRQMDLLENQKKKIDFQQGSIHQSLKDDQEKRVRLGTLLSDAESKKADYEKWSRMNQLIGDATGSKFRKIAQSYVLATLIRAANNYMKTLTQRYVLKVTPGTFVITLEDAYQGFVSRAATTISGGESFLVSLSLALALSDIGQTLSVDTLFIDEGFGTLSGEPLQNAINTLRSLHTINGRRVGIISHVEELKERIPVQIQVIQEGNNSSSTVKIIPQNNGEELTSIK